MTSGVVIVLLICSRSIFFSAHIAAPVGHTIVHSFCICLQLCEQALPCKDTLFPRSMQQLESCCWARSLAGLLLSFYGFQSATDGHYMRHSHSMVSVIQLALLFIISSAGPLERCRCRFTSQSRMHPSSLGFPNHSEVLAKINSILISLPAGARED